MRRTDSWKGCLVLGTVLLGAPRSATPAADPRLDAEATRLAAAQRLADRGRIDEALAALPEAGSAPLECERRLTRAELLDRAGQIPQALAEIDALLQARCSPGLRLAALQLGWDGARRAGEPAAEMRRLEPWIEARSAEYREAVRQAGEGRSSLAIQKVLNRDGPPLAEGWTRLAELRRQAGDTPAASRAHAEIWLRFPHTQTAQKLERPEAASPEELYGRARILAALGRLDAAVPELAALAALARSGPLLERVLLDLGELEERRRNGAASAAALERLLGMLGPADPAALRARYLLARTLFRRLPARKGRTLPLLETLDGPGVDPRLREQALQFRVGVLQEEGLDAKAMALLAAEGARKDSSVRDWALEKLGWLRLSRNDGSGALEAYEALLALPASGEARAAGLFWAGRCLEALGRRDPAVSRYAEAAAEFPLHWYGVQALLRLGEAERRGLPKPPSLPLVERLGVQRLPAARASKIEALLAQALQRFAGWELEAALAEEPDNLRVALHLAKLRSEEGELEQSILVAARAFGSVRYAGPPRVPAEVLRLLYPLAYSTELRRYSAQYQVSPTLAAGVIHQESSFFPHVVSAAGAVGLMQLLPETARRLAARLGRSGSGELALTDPALNLELGLYHLADLLRSYGGQSVPAVASYNAGPARVGRWWSPRSAQDLALFVERIPYSETRDYVKKVLGKAEAYRRLYPELHGAVR
jgi:soluble lytic murein transglycosylase